MTALKVLQYAAGIIVLGAVFGLIILAAVGDTEQKRERCLAIVEEANRSDLTHTQSRILVSDYDELDCEDFDLRDRAPQ